MSIPDLDLDNRSFQDLVDEARTRIRANCPEWTEHNVSDPGITLVESFAWMTDQLIYRLNQVPDKLHVALLNLLGIRREPASAARTGVRFRLIDGAELPVLIPAESTEVATTDGTVVFRVEDDFVVPPVRLASVVTAGAAPSAQPHTIPVSDGAARPAGDDDAVIFSSPRPVACDAIHLGFASALSRLVIRVDVAASSAHGSGVVADDPPLVWEVSGRDGGWVPVEVITDTTGGFNRPTGHVELQMPPETAPRMVGTRSLHWLRCVVSDTTRSGRAADLYETSPRLSHITARVVGALVVAVNATREHEELLGPSDDTPGQTFGVRHDSALKLERKHDGHDLGAVASGRVLRRQRARRPALPLRRRGGGGAARPRGGRARR
jgi:predicted phage baseplate assembly protein